MCVLSTASGANASSRSTCLPCLAPWHRLCRRVMSLCLYSPSSVWPISDDADRRFRFSPARLFTLWNVRTKRAWHVRSSRGYLHAYDFYLCVLPPAYTIAQELLDFDRPAPTLNVAWHPAMCVASGFFSYTGTIGARFLRAVMPNLRASSNILSNVHRLFS